MDKSFEVLLKCLFCHQTLTYDSKKDQKPEAGDMIKCSHCGELNDYESVVEIAKNEGVQKIKKQVVDDFKKAFKNFK